MADWRLDSGHLGLLPRRQEYRRAREALLGERGWLTLGAEGLRALVGAEDDSSALIPVRPDRLLPDTQFVLVDPRTGGGYPLQVGLNTVGRLPSNDIVLGEGWVSRRHCVLLVHARGGCDLHDTASLNGTFVNDRRVREPVRLASGDRIRICDKLLLFVSEKDYQAAAEDDDHSDTIVR
jgi:hypothetical protein